MNERSTESWSGRRRVAITGIGCVTPLGTGVEALWSGLRAERSVVRAASHFDASIFRSQCAAEVDGFDAEQYLDAKRVRRLDRFGQFSVVSARLALEDSGIDVAHENRERIGAMMGTALGGVAYAEAQAAHFMRGGLRDVDATLALCVFGGSSSCNIAIEFGVSGPNSTNAMSCASGTIAIGEAFRQIRDGYADVMIAGGSEAPLATLCFGAFALIRAMSSRNDDPTRASRPFDKDRDGFVMGEGASVLILEEWDRAVSRGARIYGELAGFGTTNDAHHMTAPLPGGAQAARCMRQALGDAGVRPEQVDYINGGPETKMGRVRTANGHPKPYGVKWWGIGNEMYGEWQLGHMPLSEYVKKHNRVVDAMRAVDPKIVPIGVGAVGDWTKEMLTRSVGHMDLLSEHTYWQSKPDVPAHVEQAVLAIRKIADAHRAYRRELPSLKGKDIRLALDEWNYWYGPNEYGELGTRYFLQDGLGAAAALHEMFRNSDLFFMANYAQTVNVIGAIKTTATAAEMETTGLVQQLYRARFGTTPVEVTGDLRPLDVAAALSEDGRALTLAVVNPTDETRRLRLRIAGRALTGSGQKWVITGKDRWAHNRPGAPRGVDITTEAVEGVKESAEVGPLSVTLYSLWLR